MLHEEQYGRFLLRVASVKGVVHAEALLEGRRVFHVRSASEAAARAEIIRKLDVTDAEQVLGEWRIEEEQARDTARRHSVSLHEEYLSSIGHPYKGYGVFRSDRNVMYPQCWKCREALDIAQGSYACLECRRHICVACGACFCGSPNRRQYV